MHITKEEVEEILDDKRENKTMHDLCKSYLAMFGVLEFYGTYLHWNYCEHDNKTHGMKKANRCHCTKPRIVADNGERARKVIGK